jgi:hypothetical protein
MLPGTVPSLAQLCEAHLSRVFASIDATTAKCVRESRELDERKTELTVELGMVAQSLEDLHKCRSQLQEMKESMLDELYEKCGEGADQVRARIEAMAMPAPPAPQPHRPPQRSLQQAHAPERSFKRKGQQKEPKPTPSPSSRAWTASEKAQRLAEVLPADATEREALMRRQIVVRGLKPGMLDEVGLASVLNAAFRALPSFDHASNSAPACALVQMYAGGTYAFVAMRSAALAATATRLPPLVIDGASLTITRVRGFEGLDAAEALPVPSGLDLSEQMLDLAPSTGSAGSRANLETRLYWSLRKHQINPRPAEKEVKEAFAFFKKCEKMMGKRQVIVDCCGSHGLIGAIFAAYGRAREAVVVDLHRPGSFDQVLDAWAPWVARAKQQCDGLIDGLVEDHGAGGDGSDGGSGRSGVRSEGSDSHASSKAAVRFLAGDFKELLPALLDSVERPTDIAVVACHACTHLTDAIISMCIARGVDFAVMPCCQRDLLTQGQMAIVAKSVGIKEQVAVDIARLGGIAARGYDCRWRTIDAAITPQNRVLIGLARLKPGVALQRQLVEANSSAKIKQIYSRIHSQPLQPPTRTLHDPPPELPQSHRDVSPSNGHEASGSG